MKSRLSGIGKIGMLSAFFSAAVVSSSLILAAQPQKQIAEAQTRADEQSYESILPMKVENRRAPARGGHGIHWREALEKRVTALGVCPANAPRRFVDNGDGTICDNQTGLMWEKKLAEDGSDGGNCADSQQANRDVHCVNNLYSPINIDTLPTDWSELTQYPPNGTAYTVFLATLNQDISPDPFNDTCFANHCDWRIPRLSELKSLLLEPCPPVRAPCVDPILGPTSVGPDTAGNISAYLTSTSEAVWYSYYVLTFADGGIGTNGVTDAIDWVRAVRGGR